MNLSAVSDHEWELLHIKASGATCVTRANPPLDGLLFVGAVFVAVGVGHICNPSTIDEARWSALLGVAFVTLGGSAFKTANRTRRGEAAVRRA